MAHEVSPKVLQDRRIVSHCVEKAARGPGGAWATVTR